MFPQVGISIHFIRVQSGQVKVGIDAPRDIVILRDEMEDSRANGLLRRQIAMLPKEVRHDIRNELQQISIGMHLYRELVRKDMNEEAEGIFQQLVKSLEDLSDKEAFQSPCKQIQNSGEFHKGNVTRKVVLIEDEANERKLLGDVLRMKGYSVVDFCDGKEALDYFHDRTHVVPDAVLVDMHMPVLDGKSTVAAMRDDETLNEIPIFAVSGTSPTDNGIPMGATGVNRWFPKPISVDALSEAIDQAVSASVHQAPSPN